MQKKYEFVAHDWVIAGQRRLFRIRAVRDFGDVRCGDLGGYIECEENLCHLGDSWVHDVAQVYGPGAVVRENAQVRGESWILGQVDGDAQICDLVVISEHAHVGGHTILYSDEIVRSAGCETLEPSRATVSSAPAMRCARRVL